MKKMRRKRSARIRISTKTQEKDLLRKAKKLKENPELILPTCGNDECKRCAFEGLRKQIKRVWVCRDDEKKLLILSKRGNLLARAYAAALLLTHQKKAPYLAVAKVPFGTITYAVRGKTTKDKLIAVQHFEHQQLRLVGIADIVKRKGLHIYSKKDEMICTGTRAKPPIDFIEQTINELKTKVTEVDGLYICSHLNINAKQKEPLGIPYITINWIPAGKTIAICESCAKNSGEHTLGKLTRYIAVRKIKDEFDVDVMVRPMCMAKCDKCEIAHLLTPKIAFVDKYILKSITDQYISGGITNDAEFIQRHLELSHLKPFGKNFKKVDKRIIISENRCYGADINKFVASLNPNEEEKLAIESILAQIQTVVNINKHTPNSVLTSLWDEFGEEAIFAVTKDEEIARELYKKSDITTKTPSHILREAVNIKKHKQILASLPKYTNLPTIAEFADKIVRNYKTKGKDDALRILESAKINDHRIKSLSYAFLLVFEEKGKDWQYSKTEREFGEFLKDPAQKLLESNAKEYHSALQELLKATGSTEIIP